MAQAVPVKPRDIFHQALNSVGAQGTLMCLVEDYDAVDRQVRLRQELAQKHVSCHVFDDGPVRRTILKRNEKPSSLPSLTLISCANMAATYLVETRRGCVQTTIRNTPLRGAAGSALSFQFPLRLP
jgi:hypothetical protein